MARRLNCLIKLYLISFSEKTGKVNIMTELNSYYVELDELKRELENLKNE